MQATVLKFVEMKKTAFQSAFIKLHVKRFSEFHLNIRFMD